VDLLPISPLLLSQVQSDPELIASITAALRCRQLPLKLFISPPLQTLSRLSFSTNSTLYKKEPPKKYTYKIKTRMEKELHLHKLSLTPDLSLGPGDTGKKPEVAPRPSLAEMGQTPSSAPDREAVADQETEFIGSVFTLSLVLEERQPLSWTSTLKVALRKSWEDEQKDKDKVNKLDKALQEAYELPSSFRRFDKMIDTLFSPQFNRLRYDKLSILHL